MPLPCLEVIFIYHAAFLPILIPRPGFRGAGAGRSESSRDYGSALVSGYGREHELEANRLGAEYLARSGYDPQAMIKVIGVAPIRVSERIWAVKLFLSRARG